MHHASQIGDEWVKGLGYVFADIDSARPQMGEQFLKADDLLFGLVSAVIDDKIKDRHFPSKLAPEFSIGLIADEYFDHAVLVALAR